MVVFPPSETTGYMLLIQYLIASSELSRQMLSACSITNGERLVSHKTLLSDVKVEWFFFATEQKHWLHVVKLVFDGEFRTVETNLVDILRHEWRDACLTQNTLVRCES